MTNIKPNPPRFTFFTLFMVILTLVSTATLPGCQPVEPGGVSLSTPIRQKPWPGVAQRGTVFFTTHYRIYTSTGDRKLRIVLPGFMEACYGNYLDLTGLADLPASTEKMPMYMLASRAEWLSLTRGKFGQAKTAEKLQAGGYTYKGTTVCWNIGPMVTYSVASHEGLHQFLYYRLKSRLPLWAEEGLATNAEGFVFDRGRVRFLPKNNVLRLVDLRQAILGDYWIPLKKLLTTSPAAVIHANEDQAVGYYGQVWAIVNFLRTDETYAPRWKKMLADAQAGLFDKILSPQQRRARGPRYTAATGQAIFKHYIDPDIEQFEKRYKTFCRKLVKLQP
ncbi:MAG: hypothetical protein DRP83_07075 [Planctomycetota bacterium]|nr:MAG: hypothetical protein DRP83_07075 [Planctomycetota bacterium]